MSDFIRKCNRLIKKQSAKELAILNQYIFNKGKKIVKSVSCLLSAFDDDFDIKTLKNCKRIIKKDPIDKRTYLGRKKRSYPYPNKSQVF